MLVKVKRAYDEISDQDGIRILVDRIWPRGISKQRIKVDYWMKQLAPSTELRKWFNHDVEKFEQFKVKYMEELKYDKEKIKEFTKLVTIIKETHSPVTLIYGAKNKKYNQAVVLKEILLTQENL